MKIETLKCDIEGAGHKGEVTSVKVPLMFDHDQEDGKSKTEPYFELGKIEMCKSCYDHMISNKRIVYAYGAMGYNKYYLS